MKVISQTVAPLVGATLNGSPRPVGSGVLVRFGAHHFIFSAAHVLDEVLLDGLFLPGKQGFVPLRGEVFRTMFPEGIRDNDRIDLACMRVDEIKDLLSEDLCFLPSEYIHTSHSTGEGRHYRFSGYPHKGVELKSLENNVGARLETYEDVGIPFDLYLKAGLDPRTHIAITFNDKKARDESGQIITPKNQSGTSGGGVWAGEKNADEVVFSPRLVAIVIEHDVTHKILIGTKLGPLVELVRKVFPETTK
jgi:hypothetical protein